MMVRMGVTDNICDMNRSWKGKMKIFTMMSRAIFFLFLMMKMNATCTSATSQTGPLASERLGLMVMRCERPTSLSPQCLVHVHAKSGFEIYSFFGFRQSKNSPSKKTIQRYNGVRMKWMTF